VIIRATFDAAQEPAGWFGLVWEHDGACYPYVGYMDFGADVLGQWTVAARELVRGAGRVELPFVEGDFSVIVSRIDPDAAGDPGAAGAIDQDIVLIPEGVEPPVSWPTTIRAFARLVLETGEGVCAQLPEAGELPNDCARLRELLERDS
jgi:hypothetical protein